MSLFGKKTLPSVPDDIIVGDGWRNTTPTMQQQPAQPERWINGGKFTGRDALGLVLGTLGDTFAQQGGGNAVVAPMVLQGMLGARNAKRQAEQDAIKRQKDFEDWQRQKQWERDNPAPVNNDTVADYNFIVQQLGPEYGKTYLRNRADPPEYRQGSDGQFYRISPTTPPPITEKDWNNGQVIGGQTGTAPSGGFRTDIPSGSPLTPPRFRR